MQRLTSWLAAIFFLGCLILGTLVLRQRTQFMQFTVERGLAEKEEKRRLGELQHLLGVEKAAEAQAVRQAAQLAQTSAWAARVKAPPQVTTIHLGDIIRDHPEFAALMAKETRRNVIRQYGDALNALGLPPDQAARLKELLVERSISASDAQQAAAAAGLEPGSPEFQEATQQAMQGVQVEINTLLGSDAASIMARLQTSVGARNGVLSTYAPDLADAGMPLTPVQTDALAQAAMDASYTNPKDGSLHPPDYNTPDPTTGRTPKEDRVANQVAAVLTPAQLQVFKQTQQEADQRQIIMRQYTAGLTGGYRIVP
jgi:hypothetical protein